MFEIIVEEHFSAAHRIEGYSGSCSNLHGHNWLVQMCLRAKNLNEIGMALDFRRAKKLLRKVLEKLDHTFLNDNQFLKGENPTAERIAKAIFDEISLEVEDGIEVAHITVWESNSTAVRYSRE